MSTLHAEVEYVDASRDVRLGSDGIQATDCQTPGELFRRCRRTLGRCTGGVFVDRADGGVQRIGWIFERRERYDDSERTFVRQAWVIVHTAHPTRTVTVHYANLGGAP